MNSSIQATGINPKHQQEWLDSCVDPGIVNLNIRSLTNTLPYEYLFYGLDNSERTNTGVLRSHWLRNYKHIEQGGWWCNGINLLTGESSEWGCFKPDSPRTQGNKVIKYEHPPQTKTELFALQVPDHIWEKVADRYAIEKTGDSFWEWVKGNHHIPILITEGAKKAGALLTAGYAAIALPGINSGYRNDGTLSLIPQLEVFCQKYREIIFAFDCDRNPKTYQNVNRAAIATGNLFTDKGCDVSVMTWEQEDGKGIDDVIVNKSAIAFEKIVEDRLSLKEFKELKNQKLPRLDTQGVLDFFKAEFEGRLSFDDLASAVLLDGEVLEITKDLRFWFCENYRIKISRDDLVDGLTYVAKKTTFNPVLRYLDKIQRQPQRADINHLATKYFGTDEPLYDVFVKKWLISAVARALKPGCKVDTTLILQGSQGQFKSTFFNVLGGEWFNDSIGDISNKDAYMVMHKSWIIELGEFERISSKKAAGEIKVFLSRQTDTFRKPYGYEVQDYPRRSVFCASVNKTDFLLDETGNRRFWIIPLSESKTMIDLDSLRAERDAIWASALDAYLAGEQWHLTKAEESENALNSKAFELTDDWESEIFNYLLPKSETTVKDILSTHFNIDIALQDKKIQMRVANILTKLGWRKNGLTRQHGSRVVVWRPSLATTSDNKKTEMFEKGVDGVDGVDKPDGESFSPVNTFVNTSIKKDKGVDTPGRKERKCQHLSQKVSTPQKGVDSPQASNTNALGDLKDKCQHGNTYFSNFQKNNLEGKEKEEEEEHTTKFTIGQIVRDEDRLVRITKILNDYQANGIDQYGYVHGVHFQMIEPLTEEDKKLIEKEGWFNPYANG